MLVEENKGVELAIDQDLLNVLNELLVIDSDKLIDQLIEVEIARVILIDQIEECLALVLRDRNVHASDLLQEFCQVDLVVRIGVHNGEHHADVVFGLDHVLLNFVLNGHVFGTIRSVVNGHRTMATSLVHACLNE